MGKSKVETIFDGDSAKLVQAIQKTNRSLQDMERHYKKIEGASGKVGKENRQAFGARAAAELKSYAAGMIGVGTWIGTVVKGLREVKQLGEDMAAKQRESRLGLASLGQLAETPAEMKQLVNRAKQVYAAGGAESLDAAGRTVFQIASAGAMPNLEMFAQLRAQGLVEDPGAMAKAASTLVASMGAKETGTIRDVVSKAFGASKAAPSTAEQLLEAAAKSGTFARQLGISDEEVLAATTLVARATGTAEQGGTRVASLVKSLAEKGEFKGKSLAEIVGELKVRQMTAAEQKAYFGRSEAIGAFGVIARQLQGSEAEPWGLREITREAQRAQAEDRVAAKLGLPGTIPELEAARGAIKATARKELAGTRLGIAENRAQAVFADWQAEQIAAGRPVGAVVAGWGHSFVGAVMGPEATMDPRAMAQWGADTPLPMQPFYQAIRQFQKGVDDFKEALRRPPVEVSEE